MNNNKVYNFSYEKLREFSFECLKYYGVNSEVAAITAGGLLHSSLRGIDTHGIRLLPHYIDGVKNGRINPNPSIKVIDNGIAIKTLDADHSFGHYAGMKAIQQSKLLADKFGVGFVAVVNSSHCGALSYFSLEACKHDMIGIAMTHAPSRMQTYGSKKSFFGTNPICVTAPMYSEEPFCFDSAMTHFSFNKVKYYNETGKLLPVGVAADIYGNETTIPEIVEQLIPIGLYKGFGLAMVVEIFCSLLTKMPYGENISAMFGNSMKEKRFLGHFLGSIKISAFEDPPVFKKRLQEMANTLRNQPQKSQHNPIMIPGDPEKIATRVRMNEGIPISKVLLQKLDKIAKETGILKLEDF